MKTFCVLLLAAVVIVNCQPIPDIGPSAEETSAAVILTTMPSLTAPSAHTGAATSPTHTAIEETEAAVTIALIPVASVAPGPPDQPGMPETLWWSDDGRALFYQNIESQQAWAYDLAAATYSPIPYVPRSHDELAQELGSSLPPNASLVDVSPQAAFVLYRVPLPDPIPLDPPRFDDQSNPAYTFELWARIDGADLKLGLVDDCFGLLEPPIWAEDESRAVVNTYGVPDMPRACLYDAWLIDTEARSVGPAPVPWEGIEGYSVVDLSRDGQWLLVRADILYLISLETKEQLAFPDADTSRAFILESSPTPRCLMFVLEFSTSVLKDLVLDCAITNEDPAPLATIPGMVSAWAVSPDQEHVALIVKSDFPPGAYHANTRPGVWLLGPA